MLWGELCRQACEPAVPLQNRLDVDFSHWSSTSPDAISECRDWYNCYPKKAVHKCLLGPFVEFFPAGQTTIGHRSAGGTFICVHWCLRELGLIKKMWSLMAFIGPPEEIDVTDTFSPREFLRSRNASSSTSQSSRRQYSSRAARKNDQNNRKRGKDTDCTPCSHYLPGPALREPEAE
jgi:hypothetical protein